MESVEAAVGVCRYTCIGPIALYKRTVAAQVLADWMKRASSKSFDEIYAER